MTRVGAGTIPTSDPPQTVVAAPKKVGQIRFREPPTGRAGSLTGGLGRSRAGVCNKFTCSKVGDATGAHYLVGMSPELHRQTLAAAMLGTHGAERFRGDADAARIRSMLKSRGSRKAFLGAQKRRPVRRHLSLESRKRQLAAIKRKGNRLDGPPLIGLPPMK